MDVLYTSYKLFVQGSEQEVHCKAKYYSTKSHKGIVELQFKAACAPSELVSNSFIKIFRLDKYTVYALVLLLCF